MKEMLTKLIEEARKAYMAYCVALAADPSMEDGEKSSEASFIADKLIEAGVCFRLEIPKDDTARRCATCLYESAWGSDRCVRCSGHELWEGKTDGKCN